MTERLAQLLKEIRELTKEFETAQASVVFTTHDNGENEG